MKFVRFLLFPFTLLYDVITSIRNYLFDKRILSSTSFSVPVIVVGNLSVGGTGKTPQIEYLTRLLKKNHRVAILSRGYGRKTKGFFKVTATDNVINVGDEPLQYAKKFKDVIVAVDENRVEGIKKLFAFKESPNVVLLDDAFQHRKVKAKISILLTKYNDLYVDDFLLPTGNLREGKKGYKRADVIIVTKCPLDVNKEWQQKVVKKLNPKQYQQLFFTGISYGKDLKGYQKIPIKNLKEYKVLLITGIANPKPLTKFLKEKGVRFTHLKFPDHHSFSPKNIKKIKETFVNFSASKKIILTTEKDYVRLCNSIKKLHYLEIETLFLDNQQNKFDALINKQIY